MKSQSLVPSISEVMHPKDVRVAHEDAKKT
jgi:hypothetical protein